MLNWAEDGSDEAVIACIARHLKNETLASGSAASGPSASGIRKLAFPGGGTPGSILASGAARNLDWNNAEIWVTDERDVPAGHEAHNATMLRNILADSAGQSVPVHSLTEGEVPPAFDLVWLGMGRDGHIASIFPNMALADDAPSAIARVIPDPLPAEAPYARLTLTMKALTNAREIILVIRGEEKRSVLEKALAENTSENSLPVARLIRMAARSATPSVTIYWEAS